MRFDIAPCGSVWCGSSLTKKGMTLNVKNYPNLALYCKKRVAPERLKGFFMVPWCPSTTGSDYKFMAACDLTDVARAMFEGRDSV